MANIGILTRNYKEHLDKAVESIEPIRFYSNIRWATAQKFKEKGADITLYFVVAGSGIVEYQGILKDILLDLEQNPIAAKKWYFDNAPDEAVSDDDIQNGVVKTLYLVADLQKVEIPFSQTELIKLSDKKPVSEKYDRPYCIVYPHSTVN